MTTRVERRNRKRYNKAWFDNDFHMSNGGHGIDPWPSFEEWTELEGRIMPGWREELKRRRVAVPAGGVLTLPAGVSMPLVGDFVSDIARALAAEEHRQGMAVGSDPDHCFECTASYRAAKAARERLEIQRKQAACRHENLQEITERSMDGMIILHHNWCEDCGANRPVCIHEQVDRNPVPHDSNFSVDTCRRCQQKWYVPTSFGRVDYQPGRLHT
jgi:hypothetical protein